jgi:uncharacterized membrane protein
MRFWPPLGVLVLLQVAYPLVSGSSRDALVIATVLLGFGASVAHAAVTRGSRVGTALVVVTAGGGLAIEVLGVATGFPFGTYDYADALGPHLGGVPWIIPMAWAWMAWPAWLAAGELTTRRGARVWLAGLALAAWDLFLDPQMVAEGYWRWHQSTAATLPGVVPAVPIQNHVAWFAVAVLMMAVLAAAAGPAGRRGHGPADAPMLALYLWTYASSVLGHAVFLGLPASAVWGGLGMGMVAIPLAVRLVAPLSPVRA